MDKKKNSTLNKVTEKKKTGIRTFRVNFTILYPQETLENQRLWPEKG